MRKYTLIMLNMTEYTSIFLKNQSAQYARIILHVSDGVHSIRSLYNLLSIYRGRRIQKNVKYLRGKVFEKESCLSAGVQPDIFLGRGEGCGTIWSFFS